MREQTRVVGLSLITAATRGTPGEKAATPPGGQPAKNSSCWELFCCIWRHYALACEHQSYSVQHVFHEPIFWRHLPYIDDTLPTIWMNVISVPCAILSDRSCVVLLWSSQDLTLLCDTLHLWPTATLCCPIRPRHLSTFHRLSHQASLILPPLQLLLISWSTSVHRDHIPIANEMIRSLILDI